MRVTRLSSDAIDVTAVIESLANPRVGALATFIGVVRNHDPAVTGEVVALEYSAHPQAGQVLEDIIDTVTTSPSVHGIAAVHRIGHVSVGHPALVVAVATEHRAQAQSVCSDIVETIKATLPVWKKELVADGSHTWVGWS